MSALDATDGADEDSATDRPVATGAVVSHGKLCAGDDGAEVDDTQSSTVVRPEAKCLICCWRLWMADVSVSSAVTDTEVTAT